MCGKGFISRKHMKRHMQSNAGENQYHRALCCKDFLSWNHIKQQMKIHTWENPYHCSLCGKEVISGRKIKSHMKSHDREKPYPRTEQRDTLKVLLGRIHINVLGVANNHTKRRMKSLSQDTGQYNDQQRVRDSLLLRETSGLRPVSSSHLIPSLSLYLSPMAHSFIRISLPGGVGFFVIELAVQVETTWAVKVLIFPYWYESCIACCLAKVCLGSFPHSSRHASGPYIILSGRSPSSTQTPWYFSYKI